MTMIPMIRLSVQQLKVTRELYMLVLGDKTLPWRLRAQVINQYRKAVRRKL